MSDPARSVRTPASPPSTDCVPNGTIASGDCSRPDRRVAWENGEKQGQLRQKQKCAFGRENAYRPTKLRVLALQDALDALSGLGRKGYVGYGLAGLDLYGMLPGRIPQALEILGEPPTKPAHRQVEP